MNTFGNRFRFTTFGESHGKALGCIVDGVPAGIKIDEEFIQSEMDRRKPGQNKFATARKEGDVVEILSGVFEGITTGTPISMVIFNENQKSSDYSNVKDLFRPGHADFTYFNKYGLRDYRGGGRSSARETAARVAAGAIAKLMLKELNIEIQSGICEIDGIVAKNYDRIKQKPEKNSGKMRVELQGYISNEKRIQNIIDAGNRLMTARAMQYDFQPGEKIDEDLVDITRTPGYDPADATQQMLGIESRQKAAAEKAAAEKAALEAAKKVEVSEGDKRSGDGNG